jgi:hypothetical protein
METRICEKNEDHEKTPARALGRRNSRFTGGPSAKREAWGVRLSPKLSPEFQNAQVFCFSVLLMRSTENSPPALKKLHIPRLFLEKYKGKVHFLRKKMEIMIYEKK